jgi:hypothetical protein
VNAVRTIGLWSALATLAAAAGYSIVQLLQVAGVLAFPLDEILIFGFSIAIPVPFVLAMVAFHHSVPVERRIWTHCAVVLASMYAVLVIIVYPAQLAVVIPSRLHGDADSVRALAVTRGTIIWVIDGAGYLLMGLATLFAAGALRDQHAHRWLRRFMVANGLIDPVILAVYFMPWLLPLGALWIITAPGSLWLLARYFRRMSPPQVPPPPHAA